MKTVKLTVESLLIEDKHYKKGDVVLLADLKAAEVVNAGAGVYSDSNAVKNEGVNLLGDSISPAPPNTQAVNPADANAPVIAHNPGLTDLTIAAQKVGEIPESGTAAGVTPAVTGEGGDATVESSQETVAAVETPGVAIETATRRASPRNAAKVTGKAE